MATIDLIDVHKSLKGQTVLKGVNLSAEDGETLAVLGPSGAGKSVLLRLLAGLDRVTSGEICIAGHSVTHLPPMLRDVAMVFQARGLYPHLSIAQNLAFSLQLRRLSPAEIDRRSRDMADSLGLLDLLDCLPSQLTPEQLVRTALARAIIREPSVLLLDDPLSPLEPRLRTPLLDELSLLLKRRRLTSLYATSDADQALRLGERVLVLAQGAAQQLGTPVQLHDQPANLSVAALVGAPAMVLIPGRLSEDGQQFAARDGSLLPLPQRDPPAAAFGAALILGLRPSAIQLAAPPQGAAQRPDPGAAELKVASLLHSGADTRVEGNLAGAKLSCRFPGRIEAQPGALLWVSIAQGGSHLFERSSGQKL